MHFMIGCQQLTNQRSQNELQMVTVKNNEPLIISSNAELHVLYLTVIHRMTSPGHNIQYMECVCEFIEDTVQDGVIYV